MPEQMVYFSADVKGSLPPVSAAPSFPPLKELPIFVIVEIGGHVT